MPNKADIDPGLRTRVVCEVNTCTHWLPGDHCGARNIDVLYEEEGRMAEIPAQTECKTYYKRGGLASYLGSMDNIDWGGTLTEGLLPGTQANPSVTCIVKNCKYYGSGDVCIANEIYVSGRNADECQDTNCETYTTG